MSNDNVIRLNGEPHSEATQERKQRFLEGLAQSYDGFVELTGEEPTVAAWLLLDDEGRYRTGWDTSDSMTPAGAALALAAFAIQKSI